jgi:FtsH-binding integral membrane protein
MKSKIKSTQEKLKKKLQRMQSIQPEKILEDNFNLLRDLARNITLAYLLSILLKFTGIFDITQYLDTGLFLVTVTVVDTLALTTYAEINNRQRITEAIFVVSVLLIVISGIGALTIFDAPHWIISFIASGILSGLYLEI